MNNTGSIGVFDSGVGGLTVVSELMRLLPNESIVYFGDIARTPYGSKSQELIKKFSYQITKFLVERNKVKSVVIACNTASSVSFNMLKDMFKEILIVDVITPAVKAALALTKNCKIGIIGTKTTIETGSFERLIKANAPYVEVIKKACPLFVPLVEEGWIRHEITYQVAKEYLFVFNKEKIDTLILGCTHYPLLKGVIRDVLGDGVNLVDTSVEVSKALVELLVSKGMLNDGKSRSKSCFFVSDEPAHFIKIAQNFLSLNINEEDVHKIDLWHEI